MFLIICFVAIPSYGRHLHVSLSLVILPESVSGGRVVVRDVGYDILEAIALHSVSMVDAGEAKHSGDAVVLPQSRVLRRTVPEECSPLHSRSHVTCEPRLAKFAASFGVLVHACRAKG